MEDSNLYEMDRHTKDKIIKSILSRGSGTESEFSNKDFVVPPRQG